MPQTPASGKRLAYIPALDGLRAVSILLVVGSHAGLDHVLPGAFGVTLFFFISGYLITGQLLHTLQTDGHLHLANFYARRMLRLMPAATAYIVVAGALFSVAGGLITASGWACALLYGANYYDLSAGYKSTLAGIRHPFNILWSLAIEEHFYALWPAALAFLWRRRLTESALLALCLAVLCWRAFLHADCLHGNAWVCGQPPIVGTDQYNRLYIATDTRLDSIAYGALLAALERAGRRLPRAVGAATLLLAASFLIPGSFMRQVVRTTLQGTALVFLVPALLRPNRLPSRLLCIAPAIAIGRLSYSLYLWHWGAFALADAAAVHAGTTRFGLAWQAVALPLAGALALCSYHYIERPMLSLRRRAGSHAPLTLTETPHAAS